MVPSCVRYQTRIGWAVDWCSTRWPGGNWAPFSRSPIVNGTEAPSVVALGVELDLVRPLVQGRAYLEAEVAWAVRHELALSLDDVLARRTRLAQELADRGAAIAPRVAEILGAELGWDGVRQRFEMDRYLESARREYSVAPPGPPGPIDGGSGSVD